MSKRILLALSTTAIVLASQSAFAFDYPGMQYEHDAKITMHQAQLLALKAYPGTIVEEKLKYKLGGSGLRYSFDIVGHHMTHDVAVDAKTGKILKNTRDTDGN